MVALEKEKGPYNYEIFVEAAVNQGYGLWQYRKNTLWKEQGYDIPSENLFTTNPEKELTVDQFLEIAREKVNANLG